MFFCVCSMRRHPSLLILEPLFCFFFVSKFQTMVIPRWQHSRSLPLMEFNRKAALLIGCWKHFLPTTSLYLFGNI